MDTWSGCRRLFLALSAMLLLVPTEARGDCTLYCDHPSTLDATEEGNVAGDTGSLCYFGSFGKYCETPELLGVTYSLDDPNCDPHGPIACDVIAESEWHFPGNGSNACLQGFTINAGWLLDDYYCGLSTTGTLDTDLGTATARFSATCESPGSKVLRAIACQGLGSCHKETDLPLDVSGSSLCNPLPNGCGEGDGGAGMCCFGPGGASGPGGAPPGFGMPGTNAKLVYQAQGVGHPGSPGSSDWITVSGLGRYWVHELATRIVGGSSPTVWLITKGGTFRRFTDTNADELYDEVSPSDEFRTLVSNVPSSGEWTLTDLDGTQTVFNSDGSWQSTTDRFGNAWTSSYVSGLLDEVTFPDGRKEVFTYVAGRLDTVQQVGLESDGTQADCSTATECRTWTYTWNGDDLESLVYPDGTSREFFYDATTGYMTRRDLVEKDEGQVGGPDRRVEAAWEYTAGGRIYRTWRGATSYTDTAAIEQYEFSYDDESQPTSVQVTDPFNQTATYEIGYYDSVSLKPRLESVTGQCPSCGGADDEYEYDPGQPLLPTARIDGEQNRTELTYNANGTVATRTEAVGTSQVRTTVYDYDTTFPGLRTLEQRPTTGASGTRQTVWSSKYPDPPPRRVKRCLETADKRFRFPSLLKRCLDSAQRFVQSYCEEYPGACYIVP